MAIATGLQLEPGVYYVRNQRLYYIIDVEYATENLLIENCQTLVRDWVTAFELYYGDIRVVESES